MPPLIHPHDPLRFWTEFAFSAVIIVLCLAVYWKTARMYRLTKHPGIRSFRMAFLYFSFAYLTRFVFHLFQMGMIAFDQPIPRMSFFPIFLTMTGYFSTMAIFFLAYSTIWKKVRYSQFFGVANVVGIAFAVVSQVTRSPLMLAAIQLPLLILAGILAFRNDGKKHPVIRWMYVLVCLFWLVNLFVMGPPRLLPFEVKWAFQVASLGIFLFLLSRVMRWAK